MTVIKRTDYGDTSGPFTTATAKGESKTDMEQFLLPLERATHAALHDSGIASGLEVTATIGGTSASVAIGVAFDGDGRTIVLSRDGLAITDPEDDPDQMPFVATVGVDPSGLLAFTTTDLAPSLTGAALLTLSWREFEKAEPLEFLHTPWLRLVPAAGFMDAGAQVVLAALTLGAGGVIDNLEAGPRRLVGLPASRVEFRRPRTNSGTVDSVDQVAGGVISARPDGGLDVSLLGPNAPAQPAISIDGVTGDVALTSSFHVRDRFAVDAVGNVTAGGDAEVAGSFKTVGSFEAGGNAQVDGSFKADGSAQVGGSFKADGNVTAGGNAEIAGSFRAGGNAQVAGSFKVGDDVTAGGNAEIAGNAEVGGDLAAANVGVSETLTATRVAVGTDQPLRDLHVEGSEVHSGGTWGGYSFADRDLAGQPLVDNPTLGERWTWYAQDGLAHLWSGGDLLTLRPPGPGGGLEVSGDLVARKVGVSETLTATRIAVGTETPRGDVHVEGSEVHSGGGGAGFSFADRARAGQAPVENPGAGERWVWYANAGAARLWSGFDRITVSATGEGGGLDVRRRMRVRQGGDASAGIWFHQAGPSADRAFIGMADNDNVGFWGNVGLGWGLRMNCTSGELDVRGHATLHAGAHITGNVVVGAGGDGGVKTRHVMGKNWQNDNDDDLFLNWSTGRTVHVGGGADASLRVSGETRIVRNLSVGGKHGNGFDVGFPGWSGGGIGTWDMFARGGIFVGVDPPNAKASITNDGIFRGVAKLFVIDHPLDPEHKSLQHTSIEGPEAGVYYRGEARLDAGRARVVLPEYFEALTRAEGRTVLLTPICDPTSGTEVDGTQVGGLAATRVEDGAFEVLAGSGTLPSQAFFWEVKAVRADIEPLDVEVDKALAAPRMAARPGQPT